MIDFSLTNNETPVLKEHQIVWLDVFVTDTEAVHILQYSNLIIELLLSIENV